MSSAEAVSAEAATETRAVALPAVTAAAPCGQVVDRESVHVEVCRDRVLGRSRVGPDIVVQIDEARNADGTVPVDLRVLRCAVADDADDEAVLDDDGGSFDDPVGQHRPDIGDAVVACNLQSGRFHAPHDGRDA